jgi:flagellar protein FliS
MLLGGACGFLKQAAAAIQNRDLPAKVHLVNRVSAIIEQLAVMLNFEEGGEVVDNLCRIYDWWMKELLEASSVNAPGRLLAIGAQMEKMQETWQQRAIA